MSDLTERRSRAQAYLQALAWLESIPRSHRPETRSTSSGEADHPALDLTSLSLTLATVASPCVRGQFESLVAELEVHPRGGTLDATQRSLIRELAQTMADEVEAALDLS